MDTGKVIAGAIAGIAIGAALGVLFAPDKGTNTRRKLTDNLDGLKQKYNGAIDSITSKLDGMQRQGQGLYEEGKEMASNANAGNAV